MFRFRKSKSQDVPRQGEASARQGEGSSSQAQVNARLCTDKFNGKYPHVGLYDCRSRKVWIAKRLSGQAIRTSHARLITGAENAVSTVWKDRFLCFWFYTPGTSEAHVLGYPIEVAEAHLMVRIDPNWDYDRQQIVPGELQDQVDENLERQFRHGERIFEFYKKAKLRYPVSLHYIGQRAVDSQFYVRRIEAQK
jgi:hypothetical protein